MDGKQIKKQVDKLKSERTTVDNQWELIKKFVTPYRGNFFKDIMTEHSIEWRENREIYDSTAVMANITLANSIHGSLTSPSFRWFYFGFRNEELNQDGDAKEWLEECANITYSTLQDSNFNIEASETYTDLTSYGTSVIMEEVIEDGTGKFEELIFQSIPVEQCYYEVDHRGKLVRIYRLMQWSAEQIFQRFPDAPLPSKVQAKYDAKDPTADIKVIFCIYQRPDKMSADIASKLTPENRPYGWKYVLYDDSSELGMGGYYEMPAYVPRWRKTADSKFGNSPAMVALADILTVNRLVELILASCEKVVDPAILTTERGLLTDLDLGPSGLNIVRKMGEMEVFESKARFDVSSLERSQLQLAIRQAFYVDQLELKDSPAMTAMEVRVRYELMQRLLGPTLGRLEHDFLNPMVSMTFNNLYRYGKFPTPPASVAESGESAAMDIQYIGPLNRAQKADVVASIQSWLATVAPMADFKPEVLDIPDFDEIVRHLADLEGVPTKLTQTNKEVTAMRTERQAQEQVAQNAALMQEVGKGAQAMNEAEGAA